MKMKELHRRIILSLFCGKIYSSVMQNLFSIVFQAETQTILLSLRLHIRIAVIIFYSMLHIMILII